MGSQVVPWTRLPSGDQIHVQKPSLIDYCIARDDKISSLKADWRTALADHCNLFITARWAHTTVKRQKTHFNVSDAEALAEAKSLCAREDAHQFIDQLLN